MIASPLIRNDLLKALHVTLLQILPAQTRTFWKKNPLVKEGSALGEAALLRHIWEDGAQSPLDYLNRVLNSLEPFLLEHSVPVEEFVENLSYWGNRASFLSARFVLRALNPLLPTWITAKDAMYLVLVFTELAGSRLVKGLNFPILKRVKDGDRREVIAMIKLPGLLTRELTPWDGYLYSAKLLRRGPKALGLPAFDSVDMLGDARPAESVVWEGSPARIQGGFSISGERVGEEMDFSAFCDRHQLDMGRYDLPGRRGIAMVRDYYCPKRKRVVLHKDCFYGAPAYLFKIRYSANHPRPDNHLFHFIEEATLDELPEWDQLKGAHLELVEAVRESVRFEYRGGEDSIYLQGVELISGVPAKVLRRILREHVATGKKVFKFREFKYDTEIYHSSKNSGFEVSLKRLSEALEATGYPTLVKPKGKGVFEWDADCRIEFREC